MPGKTLLKIHLVAIPFQRRTEPAPQKRADHIKKNQQKERSLRKKQKNTKKGPNADAEDKRPLKPMPDAKDKPAGERDKGIYLYKSEQQDHGDGFLVLGGKRKKRQGKERQNQYDVVWKKFFQVFPERFREPRLPIFVFPQYITLLQKSK